MSERRAQPTALDEALAGLEPRGASPDFTRRVIEALDEKESAPRSVLGVWAFAAVAVAAIAVGIFVGSRPEPPLAELAAERESMLREHTELVRELESLRSMAREASPIIYLGSERDTDFVLDLSPLLEETAPTARPASLDGSREPTYFY